MCSTDEMDFRKALASTMAKFPEVTFIWKYESNDPDSFAKGIQNIHFVKWVPQTALLGKFEIYLAARCLQEPCRSHLTSAPLIFQPIPGYPRFSLMLG